MFILLVLGWGSTLKFCRYERCSSTVLCLATENSQFTFPGKFLGSIRYKRLSSRDQVIFPEALILHKIFHKKFVWKWKFPTITFYKYCSSFPLRVCGNSSSQFYFFERDSKCIFKFIRKKTELLKWLCSCLTIKIFSRCQTSFWCLGTWLRAYSTPYRRAELNISESEWQFVW